MIDLDIQLNQILKEKMQITLSVLTLQDQAPFTSMSHTFEQSGGSVGRHQRANWVLLDDKKFLSGEHFSIQCDGKDFFLVDTSTNGTFLNDSIHPLGENNSQRLTEGDRIRMGEYVIMVSIFSAAASPSSDFPDHGSLSSGGDTNDPFFSPKGHFNNTPQKKQSTETYDNTPKSTFVDPNTAGTFGQASAVSTSSDPFFSFDDSFSPNEDAIPKDIDKNIVEADTPLNIHTPLPAIPKQRQSAQVPPEVFAGIKEEPLEPDAFDFLDDEIPQDKPIQETKPIAEIEEPVEAPKPAKVTAPIEQPASETIPPKEKQPPLNKNKKEDVKASTSDSEALKMILKGAGITKKHLPTDASPETFEIIGHALKTVLQGTIELLRARAETKNHLHLDRTIIGNVENNPLKFMPNAEQVIAHLLTNENSDRTYTPLDKALEEAFDDIMAHQFAMTVATQNALRGVIKQHFSPQNLADNIAKDHPISSRIPLQRQAKLWSMFEKLYKDVEQEAAESFQRLLDTETSAAYEKQLMELKSLRINSSNSNNGNSNDFPE